MYQRLKRIIKKESLDNKTSNITTAENVRKVAEQTLEKLLTVKREADCNHDCNIQKRKRTRPRKIESFEAMPKKLKIERIEDLRSPLYAYENLGMSNGFKFDYTPLSNNNDWFELPEDIHTDLPLLGDGNCVAYEDVLTASSTPNSHDVYSDIWSDSSISERNNLLLDEQENKEGLLHCNFTLNGLPFKRKFNFKEDRHYLKKRYKSNISSEDFPKPSHYQHVTFNPHLRDNIENLYEI